MLQQLDTADKVQPRGGIPYRAEAQSRVRPVHDTFERGSLHGIPVPNEYRAGLPPTWTRARGAGFVLRLSRPLDNGRCAAKANKNARFPGRNFDCG